MKLMSWEKCEKEFIRKVSVDENKIKSIVNIAKLRLKRASDFKATKEYVSFVVEDYYEVIKELLVAYLLKNGLHSRNHQCMISYFYKKNPELEKEAFLVSRLSYFRNRLCYYGEFISLAFFEDNKNEIEKLIGVLLKLLK